MNSFCPYCSDLKKIETGSREELIRVKGLDVTIGAEYSQCTDCNNVFYSMDQEESNINCAYEIYRKEKNILSLESIKKLRETYKLSQRQFARLLGWSETIISQYESGRIPDRAHNDELMLLQDPKDMMRLYHKNNGLLNEDERASVGERIRVVNLRPRHYKQDRDDLWNLYYNYDADEFSGDRKFNFDKFANLIIIVAHEMGGIFKTALNKIPFYADFMNYKYYDESITGMQYVKITHGPVPDNYEKVFNLLKNCGILESTEEQVGEYIGELFTTNEKPDYRYFSEREMNVINTVIQKFHGLSASQIRDYSHEEKAYIESDENKPISYKHASSLSLELEQ